MASAFTRNGLIVVILLIIGGWAIALPNWETFGKGPCIGLVAVAVPVTLGSKLGARAILLGAAIAAA